MLSTYKNSQFINRTNLYQDCFSCYWQSNFIICILFSPKLFPDRHSSSFNKLSKFTLLIFPLQMLTKILSILNIPSLSNIPRTLVQKIAKVFLLNTYLFFFPLGRLKTTVIRDFVFTYSYIYVIIYKSLWKMRWNMMLS